MDRSESQNVEVLAQRLDVARHLLRNERRARSPLVLFDRDALDAQVALWRKHLPEVEPHFAVKTCNAPPVLRRLLELGVSFDAATAGEIHLLERLGVPPARVLCTHPIRDREDLEAIAHYRPRALVVENAAELRKLQHHGIPGPGYAPELIVRLELPFGGLSGKFGVEVAYLKKDEDGTPHWTFFTTPVRRIFEEARAIERESGARYGAFGVSSHVGTNTTKTDKYQILLRVFAHVRHRLAERDFEVALWNLGGGYPDTEKPRADGTTQEAFLAELGKHVREHGTRDRALRFVAEPGRFLVSNAGTVVIGVMQVDERRLLGQPDGSYLEVPHLKVQMNDGLYGNLLGERHDEKDWQFVPLRTAGEPFAPGELPAILNGKTCDSWDRMARMRPLPRDLAAGDHLVVPHAGAYTLVTATDFNSAPRSQLCLHWREAGELRWRLYDASGAALAELEPGAGLASAPERGTRTRPTAPRPGETMHVPLTRLVGSVAGRVEGGLLRPKALLGDDPSWREALGVIYRNEVALRLEELRPLAELDEEWQLEARREGEQQSRLLRVGKRTLGEKEAEAFRRTAAGLAALGEDPGLPTLRAHGLLPEGARPYVLQDLVEGQSLEALASWVRAASGARTDWRAGQHATLLGHLRGAALALVRTHAQGLVHGRVRLASLVVPPLSASSVQVVDWPLFGQTEGQSRALGPGDDVMGLGAALYQALTGSLPRLLANPASALAAPPELASILWRALAPREEERYPSAAELAADLGCFLTQSSVQAHREKLSPVRAFAYSTLRRLRRGAGASGPGKES